MAVAKVETIKDADCTKWTWREQERKGSKPRGITAFANYFGMVVINNVSQQNKTPELTLGAQSHRGPWEGHGKHIPVRAFLDKPEWVSSSVCRINPNEGKGVNLTVHSGQNIINTVMKVPLPPPGIGWTNTNCTCPAELGLSLIFKPLGLGTTHWSAELRRGIMFSSLFLFFPFKASPAWCKEEKPHSASWAGFCSRGNSKTPKQHFNYSTSQLFLASFLVC